MNCKGSGLLIFIILLVTLIMAFIVSTLLPKVWDTEGGIHKVFGAENISVTSMSPGSTSTITQDGNRIDVDYRGANAVIKLNGKVIWEGKGRKLECRATSTGPVLRVDGKQIWPKD